MKNNQKGFANIVLVGIVILIVAVGGYFAWSKNNLPNKEPIAEIPVSNSETTSNKNQSNTNQLIAEDKIIQNLKANWSDIETLVLRGYGHYSEQTIESLVKTSTFPTDLQFIGNDNLITRIFGWENDHIAVLHYENNNFSLLEVANNNGAMYLSDSMWQEWVNKYGDKNYPISTYSTKGGDRYFGEDSTHKGTRGVAQDLIKIPENIYLQFYWKKN